MIPVWVSQSVEKSAGVLDFGRQYTIRLPSGGDTRPPSKLPRASPLFLPMRLSE